LDATHATPGGVGGGDFPVIGEVISRYRIVEQLGEGGMGVVYRAHDEHLGRDVAIKVLRPGSLNNEEARRRFHDEARALSRLSHPSISTIYDFDTREGLDYLVMELAEGTTLERILQAGPLPEARATAIGAKIVEALAAAHDQGVIHSDLKAGNVMVSPKDKVKLLDFGLARLCCVAAASGDTVSEVAVGPVAGTVAYMAPEQLLGRELDERADLFSLGVLLFEMTTGRRPFTASPSTALINEILHRPAPTPSSAGARVSGWLERLIGQLLEKDPRRRPESAAAVERVLREGAGAAAPPPAAPSPAFQGAPSGRIGSIAVLPLENLSRHPDQEYFADGMTEALITNLAQIRALRVVSRTSVMQYKGARKPLPEIARALQADAVVEGAVARFGDRVRVTAQLIESATDRHLWARSYERNVRDVLALQAEVAQAIAEEIRVELSREERERLGEHRRVDPEAYEAYLRGRHHWNRRTENETRKAIEYFHAAIAKDPRYAQAYSGLALAYDTMGTYAFLPPAVAFAEASAAASRALEIDPTLAEAHTAIGGVLFAYRWEWEAAERELRQAITLDPNLSSAYHWYSDFLTSMGRTDESLTMILKAQALDPLSLTISMTVGTRHFYARDYDAAIRQQQKTLELDPTFVPGLRNLGGAYEQKGMYAEAIETYQRAIALSRDDLSASAQLAHALAISGRTEEARKALADLAEQSKTRYVSPFSVGAVHVGLGETDRAFEYLDQAYRTRDRGMISLRVSPRLDPIRPDPRFSDLLRRMRLDSGRDGAAAA
jgi:serine/threonine protein kinase/Tfp pilus assembly protein PilF